MTALSLATKLDEEERVGGYNILPDTDGLVIRLSLSRKKFLEIAIANNKRNLDCTFMTNPVAVVRKKLLSLIVIRL